MNIKIENPYAIYNNLPNLAYNIIEILMDDERAELLWKLLKYNEADAWNKNNLTRDEKISLIYPGGEHQEKYSIFLDYMMDDAAYEEKTYLRIYPSKIIPTNRTVGVCDVAIEILVHGKINHLSNYTTRIDTITQIMLSILNGATINNMGKLFFDYGATTRDKIELIGMKPFKGKLITMSLNMG